MPLLAALCGCSSAPAPLHHRTELLVNLDPQTASIVPRARSVARNGGHAFVYGRGAVRTQIDARAAGGHAEGYELRVGERAILLRATDRAGLFYGQQTLAQLTQQRGGRRLVPAAVIVDWPRYRWRGIHLDVARHFFDVATVEKFIDLAAHYKLNVFHWHLTDDQAWRLQVRAYPGLTARGSFYTQSQVREIVRYASRRYITVVPEIEMPAHATAARRVAPLTGQFAQTVLGEVFALFPGPFVHLGGDEVRWNPQNIGFMRSVQQFARARGKRALLWDDAFPGAAVAGTIAEVWHTDARARALSQSGRDIVMAPDGPLYFDAAQGDRKQEPAAAPHMSTLDDAYSYTPLHVSGIIGVEATLWSEKIATPEHLFYMALPRELALAELAWTPPARKNWSSFLARLPDQFAWLDAHGYVYRLPNVLFRISARQVSFASMPGEPNTAIARTSDATVRVELDPLVSSTSIAYTIDGTSPTKHSKRYTGPFSVNAAPQLTIRAVAITPNGRASATSGCKILRVALVPAGSRSWLSIVSP